LLSEPDLEAHNVLLNSKYAAMKAGEQRADLFQTEDAEVLIVACNTPGRMAKGAVRELRASGIKAGLFRPISLWPFPIDRLRPLLDRVRRIVVVEASNGQLEDEMRLAISHAGVDRVPAIDSVRRFGGILPQQREIVDRVAQGKGVLA
jgi:pyruvate/2-oxoacid:ferredoxin oxidoreductase alpha subunit